MPNAAHSLLQMRSLKYPLSLTASLSLSVGLCVHQESEAYSAAPSRKCTDIRARSLSHTHTHTNASLLSSFYSLLSAQLPLCSCTMTSTAEAVVEAMAATITITIVCERSFCFSKDMAWHDWLTDWLPAWLPDSRQSHDAYSVSALNCPAESVESFNFRVLLIFVCGTFFGQRQHDVCAISI